VIDQLKLPRTVPGLGENLLTVARPASWTARLRCQLCGCEVGSRVVASVPGGYKDTMDQLTFQFWLAHFQTEHPEKLPKEIREEL